ncbi:alanine racemase [Sinomicrobium weinanense]|uniref:Alanine racemase n=1 Tax=Sinomicrobium weinanense TaxID=2842200 RepID=A0A926JNK5_9FLAO|nr:alanine racemase [Sinomicrobium weinanense]MBC9794585.1 alanine racemase [Sinomicrobium weinanense]MBU3124070.1 alanine racemase [Sinomicrobium weinanense]
MSKVAETVLEIDLGALRHNYEYLKSTLHPGTKFVAVVKAFAYGHDATKIAPFLEKLGVDYFAVAYTSEGIELREAGIQTPVLVLHPQSVHFDSLIDHSLEPCIYSDHIMSRFLEITNARGLRDYPIHLKFNTGLNRLGFGEDEAEKVFTVISGKHSVKVASIFSHLAAPEDPDEDRFTRSQINAFRRMTEMFENIAGYRPLLHQSNTSGILCHPEAQFDMVRSGIGLYGYGNDETKNRHLRPIGTLKTVISQIHRLEKGDSLGYNRAFIAEKPTLTATLPLGHADGIGRPYGNGKGYVRINGKYAPIIGNVCMDMIMVDITDIDCREGDEVVVYGKNPSAEEFAATAGTISYELITAISRRVKRVYIGG